VCLKVTIGCLRRSRERVYESHDSLSIKVRIEAGAIEVSRLCGVYKFCYESTVIEYEQWRITELDDDMSYIVRIWRSGECYGGENWLSF